MEHLGGYLESGDPNTRFEKAWLELNPESVLDVGCGAGHNLKWFWDKGCFCFGIDGHPEAVRLTMEKGIPAQEHDYEFGALPFSDYDRDYDLGLCSEFAEHVKRRYEDNWLDTLKRCKKVLFTHALPEQGGYHHVNCQTNEYWVERFKQYGFEVDWDFTNRHRDPSAPWGGNTLTLFVCSQS